MFQQWRHIGFNISLPVSELNSYKRLINIFNTPVTVGRFFGNGTNIKKLKGYKNHPKK